MHIDFLVTEGTMTLDVAGPMDVFVTANRFVAPAAARYMTRVIGPAGGGDAPPLLLTGGLRVAVDAGIDSGLVGDTLVVAGGDNDAIERLARDVRVQQFLRKAAARYRRVASICNGALVLARAGLLDGRRATTHWEDIELLKACAPKALVCEDVLYVRDGSVFTSAGVSAGIDLALHLVERDHGRDVALRTARQLVVYLHRSGDQRQFSAMLDAQSLDAVLQPLGEWLQKHLSRTVSLDEMADAVNMSRRNFSRVFRERVGVTPGEYLERLRAEAAAALLSNSALGMQQIARRAGFGSEQALRRVFGRHYGVTPREYRRHFGSRPVDNGHA